MDKRTTFNSRSRKTGNSQDFTRMTCHLRSKDFRWLKEDMGFFEMPKSWDLEFKNDNRKSDKL